MYHLTSIKTTGLILFSVFLLQTTWLNPVFGQGGGGGGSSSQGISGSGIAGSDVSQSELTSKASQMPRFTGFDSLNRTTFIGADGTYFPQRTSSGTRLSSGQTLSAGQQSTAERSSTRTANRSTTNMRNRAMTGTMGNMGRMGGVGGANTNTVRSVTSLGYSFNETAETLRSEQTQTVRGSQLENRIKNSNKINAIAPITVEIDHSTAILRGVVENEHQRKLLEQYVKLEPGITKVQNELALPE